MPYSVYMHTSPSGKRYIGITKQSLNERWRNGEGYRRCTGFWRAIQKYGWENIAHEVIGSCDTLEEANALEMKYISLYKTNDKKYGYNCTDGGDGVTGWKANEEQRTKISESRRKLWQTPEFREKLTSERRKRGSTDDERARLKRMRDENWADPKMREQLTEHLRRIARDPQLIASRKEKMRKLWAEHPEKFEKALVGMHTPESAKKCSEAMKAMWQENRERFLKNRKPQCGEDNPNAKSVRCIETGEIFPTARMADRATGVSYKQISNAARGVTKAAGGFHWEFTQPKDGE